jgi:multiple sugar transport system substrate-binding protein
VSISRRLAGCLAAAALMLAGCGGTGGGSADDGPVTLTFAAPGLGTEGEATKAAIAAFEQANPGIKVELQTLSTDATQYLQQLTQRFVAGSTTPDVVKVDGIYAANFAKSGWLMPLDEFQPDLTAFLPNSLAAGKYRDKTYALPWFVNTEGIFYRTDLVASPPQTPQELVDAARAAMAADPNVKYGFAFEGAKYEGVITAFMAIAGGFDGTLDPANLDTPQNREALRFLYDAIYTHRIAPEAVTGWKEGDVQQAFTSGQAAFAVNWPFVFATAEGTPVQGKVGFAPFAGSGATMGAETVAINAKTEHAEAAWRFVQYLTSAEAQLARAKATGNPPSVAAAYTPELLAAAPYFEQVQQVAEVAVQRPVDPQYAKISEELQTALSSTLANLTPPDQALADAAAKIKSLVANG